MPSAARSGLANRRASPHFDTNAAVRLSRPSYVTRGSRSRLSETCGHRREHNPPSVVDMETSRHIISQPDRKPSAPLTASAIPGLLLGSSFTFFTLARVRNPSRVQGACVSIFVSPNRGVTDTHTDTQTDIGGYRAAHCKPPKIRSLRSLRPSTSPPGASLTTREGGGRRTKPT